MTSNISSCQYMHPTVALRCNKTSTETNPLLDAIRRSSFSQCCFGYTMCSQNLVGNSQTSHCQLFSLLSWGGGMVRCGPVVGCNRQIKCRLLKKRFDYNDFKGQSRFGVNSVLTICVCLCVCSDASWTAYQQSEARVQPV